jgi:hypothetical protein
MKAKYSKFHVDPGWVQVQTANGRRVWFRPSSIEEMEEAGGQMWRITLQCGIEVEVELDNESAEELAAEAWNPSVRYEVTT